MMTSSSPAPKLPMWIFWVTDAVLLTAAAYIANNSPRPLPDSATFGIVACIIAGAVVALVPLVAYYERQKNETLDDRQRALEALARTIETSAEQISIAAGGLHEIAEIAQRNLKHAEQLPQKLQEKMAEFQAQLSNASDSEKEELEKEVEELRASETERLESTADRIAKAAAEFAKLQASFQQQLSAATAATTKLATATGGAATQAQAAAEQALAHAREISAKAVGDTAATALTAIERAKAAALHDITTDFERQINQLREATRQFEAVVTRIPAGGPQPAPLAVPAPAALAEPVAAETAQPETASVAPLASASGSAALPADTEPAATEPSAPKRSRKPRHHPAGETVKPAEAETVGEPAAPPAAVAAPGHNRNEGGSTNGAHAPSAAPAVAETAPTESTAARPPAPETVAPAADHGSAEHQRGPAAPVDEAPASAHAASPTNGAAAAPAGSTRPARKRVAHKPDDDQPALGLDLGDAEPSPAASVVERVISSDGATRLIVTAYIGIGNRLFVRGNGPGLSWDKGVPLQFVSIGKWRWETNDASGPVQLKLLKNDQQESVGLGALTIDPGHQHEVTATFN